jgi:hypothetical protein
MPPTPDNGGYLVAAYTVAAVIYLSYAWRLWWKARAIVKQP